ncbi:MAG: hypothetical protein J6Z45_00355, partial [Oscillospiraceae bacterium]|nr:hypothetical protein [Oscillospiraceae bacterium]
MKKKNPLKRTLAGIVAVLLVTGNLLTPGALKLSPLAETAIVAEAADVQVNNRGYAFVDGVLYINASNANYFKATGSGENRNIDLSYGTTHLGTNRQDISKSDVLEVVIMSGAVLPDDFNRMFKGFTNLKKVTVEQGARFRGSDDYAKMSSTFEGCTNLESVDLSGLTNGDRVAYIDGLFKDCPNLTYANLSSIDGSMMGKGDATQNPWGYLADWAMWSRGDGVDPVNVPI